MRIYKKPFLKRIYETIKMEIHFSKLACSLFYSFLLQISIEKKYVHQIQFFHFSKKYFHFLNCFMYILFSCRRFAKNHFYIFFQNFIKTLKMMFWDLLTTTTMLLTRLRITKIVTIKKYIFFKMYYYNI